MPELLIAADDGARTTKLLGFEADEVDGGKASRVSFESGIGIIRGKAHALADLRFRRLQSEGVDILSWLNGPAPSPQTGDLHIAHFSWDGFDSSIFSNVGRGPAENQYEQPWTVSLGSFEGRTSYDADIPLISSFSAQHFVVTPPQGSSMSRSLKAFGYDAIDIGLAGDGRYDAAAQTYAFDHVTLNAWQMVTITATGELGSVSPESFKGSLQHR